jgi:cell division protein FtsI (penicillin-binding protein 3)
MTRSEARALHRARGRLTLLRGAIALVFLILAVRAAEVAAWQAPPMRAHAPAEAQAPRGNMYDARGMLLATDIEARGLYADPHLIADPARAARALAALLPGRDAAALEADLTRADTRFVWIARHLTPAQARAVLEIGEPGLAFRPTARRVYPQGALAAHILGYVDVDGRGLAGAERAFDADLATGRDVRLTLDIRLQHVLEREMEAAIRTFSAQAGAGVILEVPTGAVLAAASAPDFDPNQGGQASDTERFNRFALGVYELGSMFKIFSTAAYLEAHPDGLAATFDARAPLRQGRFTIRDFHAENRVLTTPEVFMHSSNIGAALMGQAVGGERLRAFYADLGLLAPMDWTLPERGRPLSPPAPWREISTLTASYGHGVAVSPLHLAVATAAVVGDGRVRAPVLAAGQAASAGPVVVAPETVAAMRALMRLVVSGEHGTARAAAVPGYDVGGKTGTAEKPSATGGYDRGRLISSFVGVFPTAEPRYLVLIVVDEPRGTRESYGYATGGWVGAPAVGRVIEGMARVLDIPPTPEPEPEPESEASDAV